MRVALHRVESDCLKPIYDNVISKEETLELVVPDVSADVGTILDVRGQFLLSSQKAKTNEIHISASVEATVIYAAEDSGKVQYIMANIPFDMMIPVPGANENTKIVTRCELCGIDARMLNPRKLLIRAAVSVQLCCYVPDKFVLWDNLSEGETVAVYTLRKEVEHTLAVGVREKTFVISDEYRLPADKEQNAKMLSASTEVCVEDVKAVGNKIVVKALAKTMAVFLNEVDGMLFDNQFTTQFSQIIEVDTFGENITNTVTIQLRDAEFTMAPDRDGGYMCSANLHMCAQAISRANKSSAYIADAYSNTCELTLETTDVKLMQVHPESSLMLNLRGKLQPKAGLSEIMYLAISSVCTELSGGDIDVTVEIGGVGKTESGELESIELKLSAEETLTLGANQKLNITCLCCDKPTVVGMPANAEVSVDIELCYSLREFAEISAVSGFEVSEDSNCKMENGPSLVVICSDREAEVWSLAKKYGSTVEMIENANKVNDEFSATHRPLLIPRAR